MSFCFYKKLNINIILPKNLVLIIVVHIYSYALQLLNLGVLLSLFYLIYFT